MFHHDEFEGKYPIDSEYDATGAHDCPMRYWQVGDPDDDNAMIWVALFHGWKIADTAPSGTPWFFCASNRAQVSFKP